VKNTGTVGTLTYALSLVTCGVPLSACSLDQSSVTLAQGASTSATVHYNTQNVVGTGTLQIRATHTATGVTDDGSYVIRVLDSTTFLPPSVVDLSSNNGFNIAREKCLAFGTGQGTVQ